MPLGDRRHVLGTYVFETSNERHHTIYKKPKDSKTLEDWYLFGGGNTHWAVRMARQLYNVMLYRFVYRIDKKYKYLGANRYEKITYTRLDVILLISLMPIWKTWDVFRDVQMIVHLSGQYTRMM